MSFKGQGHTLTLAKATHFSKLKLVYLKKRLNHLKPILCETSGCCCIPVLVTTFPERLSGTQPWPRTPGAMRPTSLSRFVVFCVHMYRFAGLIRRTPTPTFSDAAIADRLSDTTIFQPRAHWVRIFWSIGSEISFGHVPPVEVDLDSEHLIPYARN